MSSSRYLIVLGVIVVLAIAMLALLPSSENTSNERGPTAQSPTEMGDQAGVQTSTRTAAPSRTDSTPVEETGTREKGEVTSTTSNEPATTGRETDESQTKTSAGGPALEGANVFGVLLSSSNTTNSSIYGFDFVGNSTWKALDASPVYSFDFADSGDLYVTDSYAIYRIDVKGKVSEVHRFSEYGEISFMRLGPDGRIYFSRDGIYVLEGGKEVKVLNVDTDFVDEHLKGYWDGIFAVDGEGNIYLSSGYSSVSAIVKVTKDGKVVPIVKTLKSVTGGLRYVDKLTLNLNNGQKIDLSGTLMFTDGLNRIYFLDFSGEKPTLHFLKLPPLGESVIWDLDIGPARS